MTIRKRLRSLLWRVPIEQEVHEELAHHAELRTRELIDRGVDPEEARVLARMRLENGRVEAVLTQLGRQRNDSWARRDWIDELRQDLRFAWRQCLTKPGFTLAAVLTLGLGIGATTAIFSVVHAVVLKPHAYADPDRVLLTFSLWKGNRGSWSVGNFDYFRQRLTTVEEFAAAAGGSFNLADEGEPERVYGSRVTSNYFTLFGILPVHGRTFSKDEDQPGRTTVVILSDRVWRRRFNGDPAIVGRKIRMNNEPYDVIGVMPPEITQTGDSAEVWIPVGFTAAQLAMYDEFYLNAYARRKKTASPQRVSDEFARIAQSLAVDHADLNRERSAGVERLDTFLVGDYRLRLTILLALLAAELVTLALGLRYWRLARPSERDSSPAALSGMNLRAALPFALSGLMAMAYGRFDILLVAALSSAAVVADYAPASRIQDFLYLVPAAAAAVTLTLASRLYAEEGQEPQPSRTLWLQATAVTVGLSLLLAAATFLLAPVFPDIFGDDYEGSVSPLRIIAWSIPLSGFNAVLVSMVNARRLSDFVPIAYGAGLVTAAVLNVALVPSLDADGAALAATLREVPLGLLLLIAARRSGLFGSAHNLGEQALEDRRDFVDPEVGAREFET